MLLFVLLLNILTLILIINPNTMYKLLLYLNDTLESLDIPPILKNDGREINKLKKKSSKKVSLKEIK